MPIGAFGLRVHFQLNLFEELKLLRIFKYFAYLEVRKSFSFY